MWSTLIFLHEHTRKLVRSTDQCGFLGSSHDHCDWSFTHTETHSGLGCVCNIKVCAPSSDLMLRQHILLFNSSSTRSPSSDHPLLPCFYSTFRQVEVRDHMCRKKRWQFFLRFENQSFPISVCIKCCDSVISYPSFKSPIRRLQIRLTDPAAPDLFRVYVVSLEIPYIWMFFLCTEDWHVGMN